MGVSIAIGLQWGDEGKGKVIDYLASKYDYVVRYQGGANAGHTLKHKGQKIVTHTLPGAVLNPSVKLVLTDGVVINLDGLKKELDSLYDLGYHITNEKLYISDKAHITLPYHIDLDAYLETIRTKGKIGTTKRGIGPTYKDKVLRNGIRIGDLYDTKLLKEKLEVAVYENSLYLGTNKVNISMIYNNLLEHRKWLLSYITDTTKLLNDAYNEGKKILLEGAQGVLLDIDAGTYPYVTSSNILPGYASVSTGISCNKIDNIIGVVKAYTTRVGLGPFPTELTDDIGDLLRFQGGEFGATTGRPRRTGWLDLVLLKYAVIRSGVKKIAITKLDILTGFSVIKAAVSYKLKDGSIVDYPPYDLNEVEPVYKDFPSWNQDISQITDKTKLPKELLDYVNFIKDYLGVELFMLSVGEDRKSTILWEI